MSEIAIKRLGCTWLATIPKDAGKVGGLLAYRGTVYLCASRGLYRLDDGVLVKVCDCDLTR